MRKKWDAYKAVRLLTWSIGGTALVIFYLWFEFFTPKVNQDKSVDLGFNPLIWAKATQDYSNQNLRQSMYLDLVRNHLKTGMMRFEIDKKLGVPDYTDKNKNYFYLLSYQLAESEFNYLGIHFDRSDTVTMFYHTTKSHKL